MEVVKIGIEDKPHKHIISTARYIRRKIIKENGESTGMCWDASKRLAGLLRQKGFKATCRCGYFTPGGDHFWVTINNRHILDVTADQFNKELCRRDTENKKKIRMKAIVFGTRKQLHRHSRLYN